MPLGIAALASLTLLAPLGGCMREPEPAHAEPPPATRVAARAAASALVDSVTVSTPVSVVAQLYVERDAVIAARTSGVLEAVPVDLGSEVAAGGVVARIDDAAQTLAVERAEAAADVAHRNAERLRALLAVRGATSAEAEQAELAERQTAVALRDARRELSLTRVAAPFAGVVTARYARAGRLVAAGDTLLRVAERGPLLARARVPEASADALRPGDAADVVTLRGAGTPARVVRVAPAIDPASGTREIVVRLAELPNVSRPLAGATVRVRVGRVRRRALAVPRGAVQPGGYVLVVDAGRTALRSVVLGDSLPDGRVEVARGLTAGERVLVGPGAPRAP